MSLHDRRDRAARTLSDDDISSRRTPTRRSLLSTFGLGLGAAAAISRPRGAAACWVDQDPRDRGAEFCREFNDWQREQRELAKKRKEQERGKDDPAQEKKVAPEK